MTQGHCPYGDKCTFAHGMDELRPSGTREAAQQPEVLPPPPPLAGPAPASESAYQAAPRGQAASGGGGGAQTAKQAAALQGDGAGARPSAGGSAKVSQQLTPPRCVPCYTVLR
ncbi:hypothetical protein Vafri_21320 [Volvox africanus]|uniref:C3H1-type domain-containing protein n=1 Tax=Volvox africanus TaxID=51714 RepID=A0A8J4FB90_9CHLO|nr:hypothetical protein Vafri_21320 [Volvox africanus]